MFELSLFSHCQFAFIHISVSTPYDNKCFPDLFISEFSFFSHRQFAFIHRPYQNNLKTNAVINSLVCEFRFFSQRQFAFIHISVSKPYEHKCVLDLFISEFSLFTSSNSLLCTVTYQNHLKSNAVINSLFLNSHSFHFAHFVFIHCSISHTI